MYHLPNHRVVFNPTIDSVEIFSGAFGLLISERLLQVSIDHHTIQARQVYWLRRSLHQRIPSEPNSSQKLGEIGSSQTGYLVSSVSPFIFGDVQEWSTHWVPSSYGRETICITPRVAPSRDVVEGARPRGIKERIQESQDWLPSRDEPVVQERDDACEDRARTTCSTNQTSRTLPENLDIVTDGRYVGEATTCSTEFPFICRSKRRQEGRDCGGLVGGSCKYVGETPRREGGRGFGYALSGTN